MKRNLLAWVLIATLIIAGCATATVKFNRSYMPNAIPDKPEMTMAFDDENNKQIKKYADKVDYLNDIWLFWLKADDLYLNLEGSGIIVIHPSTKKTEWLKINDEKETAKIISEKAKITNDISKEPIYKRLAASVMSSFGQQYSGEFIDNSQKLQVVIKTEEKRREGDITHTCTQAKLKGTFVNNQGKSRELEWNYNCNWLPKSVANAKVPQLLRKFQISPTGIYYAYGSTLFPAIGKQTVGEELMVGYPIISASINPEWTKIAVLRNKDDQYWIEFFEIKLDRK